MRHILPDPALNAAMPVRALLLGAALVAALGAGTPTAAHAQVTASERATLAQTITGVEIEIDYSRPSTRGRDPLFGNVVPWGEVWTPGANLNTTISFSDSVTVNGVDVAPGIYGMWIQVLEEEPWQFMLHADTTLFHTDHPGLETGVLTFPVERTRGSEFVETLTLDLQRIRAEGANLQLSWGLDRVAVPIGIDPGYVMTVSAEEAERYVGEWLIDQSAGMPPPPVIEQMTSTMMPEMAEAVRSMIETMSEPYRISIEHDDQGRLVYRDPVLSDWWMVELESVRGILLPAAEGVFDTGTLLMGDLASAEADGPSGGYWEFIFDENGRAIEVEGRSKMDDRVILTARRAGN